MTLFFGTIRRGACTTLWLALVQEQLGDLAVFLGERKDSDPAALFTLLHNFTKLFDSTLVQVAKRTNQVQEERDTAS